MTDHAKVRKRGIPGIRARDNGTFVDSLTGDEYVGTTMEEVAALLPPNYVVFWTGKEVKIIRKAER